MAFARCSTAFLGLLLAVSVFYSHAEAPENLDELIRRGEELERLGVMRDVQSFWEEIIDGHAGTVPVEYFIHLARSYVQSDSCQMLKYLHKQCVRDLLKATKVFNEAAAQGHEHADLYYYKAKGLMILDDPDEAIRTFEKAIEIDPNHVSSLINTGILIKQKHVADKKSVTREDMEKAKDYFIRALTEVEPKTPEDYEQTALGYLFMMQGDKAEEWLRKTEEAAPQRKGTIDLYRKRFQKELATFKNEAEIGEL